jgi:hypothetical protein
MWTVARTGHPTLEVQVRRQRAVALQYNIAAATVGRESPEQRSHQTVHMGILDGRLSLPTGCMRVGVEALRTGTRKAKGKEKMNQGGDDKMWTLQVQCRY